MVELKPLCDWNAEPTKLFFSNGKMKLNCHSFGLIKTGVNHDMNCFTLKEHFVFYDLKVFSGQSFDTERPSREKIEMIPIS